MGSIVGGLIVGGILSGGQLSPTHGFLLVYIKSDRKVVSREKTIIRD